MNLTREIEAIQRELKKDKGYGSYYYGWQSNIACCIKDNVKDVTHEEANNAAIAFLEILIAE